MVIIIKKADLGECHEKKVMKSLEDIKHALSPHREAIFLRYRIRKMAIFGSFAQNTQQRGSDIDILVEFDAPTGIEFVDLGNQLEALLKRRVDLVSRNCIKPRHFEQIKKDLKYI